VENLALGGKNVPIGTTVTVIPSFPFRATSMSISSIKKLASSFSAGNSESSASWLPLALE
jgi:hypothetical protein